MELSEVCGHARAEIGLASIVGVEAVLRFQIRTILEPALRHPVDEWDSNPCGFFSLYSSLAHVAHPTRGLEGPRTTSVASGGARRT